MNDTSSNSQTPCAKCGKGVDRGSRNRPTKFCSSDCRKTMWRELREARRPPTDPDYKKCGRCKETMARTEFRNDATRRDGKYSYCNECTRAYNGSQAMVSAEHTKNEYNRLRYHRMKQDLGADVVARYNRSTHLKNKFNLTADDYDAMLAAQNGRCAICGVLESECLDLGRGGARAKFAVDHDHSCCSGRVTCGDCVRSLLCRSCNTGLGMFKDNPDLLTKAMGYLAAHKQAA